MIALLVRMADALERIATALEHRPVNDVQKRQKLVSAPPVEIDEITKARARKMVEFFATR